MPQRRHLILVSVATVLATVLIALLFRGQAETCVELGCLGLVLFYPISATAAALASMAVSAYSGRGCRGQAEGMFWAVIAWLATLYVIAAAGPFRR